MRLCGSEAKAKTARGLGVIERLDAEGIARQHQPARRRVVQRDRVHAAQVAGEIEAVAAIEMERQLAIGRRREHDAGQRPAQLDVIVDLGIGDERRAAGLVQRLVAGREIDDGEPRLHHARHRRRGNARCRRARDGAAIASIACSVAACGRLAVERHDAGDAAHQRRTRARTSR